MYKTEQEMEFMGVWVIFIKKNTFVSPENVAFLLNSGSANSGNNFL